MFIDILSSLVQNLKKGDIDNRFVIDVIDTYIDIMDTLKNIDKHIKRK